MEALIGLVLPSLITPLKPMNYIHAENSIVIEYPYSVEKLRSDNPETCFPAVMSEEELAAWGVYPLAEEAVPAFNEATEQLEQTAPIFKNGVWSAGWIVVEASELEKANRAAAQAAMIRFSRNQALSATDPTQLLDYKGTEIQRQKYAQFRQELRDVPAQAGFPWNVVWPINEMEP